MIARPALTRFLVARGASTEDAADLIQELYLKLDRVPIASVSEPRAYLYRMADNLLLDRRRSSLRRLRRDDEWTGLQSGVDLDRDPQPSAEQVLISRERLAAVMKALDALPARTAEAFRRFRLGGETQKAIAADFDISVSAVEKHLQRAYRAVHDVKTRLDADDEAACRLRVTDGTGDD